jgi:hypothetical protein
MCRRGEVDVLDELAIDGVTIEKVYGYRVEVNKDIPSGGSAEPCHEG